MHWLESRWHIAVGALVAVVLVSVAFVHWGVPAVANWAADVMPTEVDRAIGAGTLDCSIASRSNPRSSPASVSRCCATASWT